MPGARRRVAQHTPPTAPSLRRRIDRPTDPCRAADLSHRAKTAKKQLLGDLQRLQEPVLQATGVFVSGGAGPARRQRGVLRTNCIDSLDRTNVAQFSFGMLAMGQQLHALGISGAGGSSSEGGRHGVAVPCRCLLLVAPPPPPG